MSTAHKIVLVIHTLLAVLYAVGLFGACVPTRNHITPFSVVSVASLLVLSITTALCLTGIIL